jgi:hypothetical protein
MEQRLLDAGFSVVRSGSGTYPGFPVGEKEKYKKALRYLFEHRVRGWWNQPMREHGICTEEEFSQALEEAKEEAKQRQRGWRPVRSIAFSFRRQQ